MSISLSKAAKYYQEESHQLAAWNFLESALSEELLKEFAELYRAGPSEPSGNVINPDVMQQLTGYTANNFGSVFCDDFNKLLKLSGFDKHKDATAMLTANLMHETGNFRWMKELADGTAYNNRSDLGNGPNDGPKYKGAGVLMLTGKYNYRAAAEDLNDPLILTQGCDYTAEKYPFRSALGWIENNNLLNICLTKGFDECCYRINGGWNGYEDRLAKYKICQRVFRVQ